MLLLLLASLASPPCAQAHQRLLQTEPSRDATLATAPREMRLRFSEPVQLAFTRLELGGPSGPVQLGEPRAVPDSATVLVVPIVGPLEAGGYAVRWATASRDGHPVRGEFGFMIAEDAAGLAAPDAPAPAAGEGPAPAPPPPASFAADPFGADSPAYVAIRWATYIALLGVIGAVAFAVLVLGLLRRRRAPDDDALIGDARGRAAAAGIAFAAALLVLALARLYAQSLAVHGRQEVLDPARIGVLLGQTVWGLGWWIQAGAALLAAAGFVLARRSGAVGWAVAAVAALALAVSPALSGHAAALTGVAGAVAIGADAVHVLGAGGWLGTLLLLLLVGMPAAARLGPARRGAAVAALVRAFSPVALFFAGILVLSGFAGVVIHMGSLDALLGSRYGTLLFLKLGITLFVFGAGAYNYLRVEPALGDDGGTGRLRRSATVELVFGTAVLLVTAMLVATARPYDETGEAGADIATPSAVLHTPMR
jgi:copper transport protein